MRRPKTPVADLYSGKNIAAEVSGNRDQAKRIRVCLIKGPLISEPVRQSGIAAHLFQSLRELRPSGILAARLVGT